MLAHVADWKVPCDKSRLAAAVDGLNWGSELDGIALAVDRAIQAELEQLVRWDELWHFRMATYFCAQPFHR